MGELTDRIMKELKIKNPKSLKRVREIIEMSEETIMDEIVLNILNTIIEHVEISDKITLLELYLWIKKQRDDILTKEEEEGGK